MSRKILPSSSSTSLLTTPTKWHPKTRLYNYNYGIGMNYYQPMVDYIDQKSHNNEYGYYKTPIIPIPHLPWTDELGLRQFNPLETRSYSEHDLLKISDKTEKSAKIRLAAGRSHTSSSFVLAEAVGAARIATTIHQEGRKKDRLVKEIRKLKNRMLDDIDYDPQSDRNIERELRAEQKYLRGKSAKSIEAQLLAKSRKQIAECVDHDYQIAHHHQQINDFSTTNRRVKTQHIKIMNEKLSSQFEQSIHQPLEILSQELHDFDRRATHSFIDQR